MNNDDEKIKRIAKEVGERIKELRKKKNESQAKLGDDIGLSQNSISKIEKGDTMLTLEHQIKIADHFHVSHDYICKGMETNSFLDILKKYISLEYEKINVGTESFACPILKINSAFFDCLVRSAHAQNSYAPDDIRSMWLEKEIETFYERIKQNKLTDVKSVIPLPQELIFPDDKKSEWRQTDLLRELNEQLLKDLAN